MITRFGMLLVITIGQLTACAAATQQEAATTFASADLYAWFHAQPLASQEDARAEALNMSIPALYRFLLTHSDDDNVVIDGVAISGVHSRLVAQRAAYLALGDQWPTLGALWRYQGTASKALGLVQLTCEPGKLFPGGTYTTVTANTDDGSVATLGKLAEAAKMKDADYYAELNTTAEEALASAILAAKTGNTSASDGNFGGLPRYPVLGSDIFAYADPRDAGQVYLGVGKGSRAAVIKNSKNIVSGCFSFGEAVTPE